MHSVCMLHDNVLGKTKCTMMHIIIVNFYRLFFSYHCYFSCSHHSVHSDGHHCHYRYGSDDMFVGEEKEK